MHAEGVAEVRRAARVDPANLGCSTGQIFYWARQYDKALEESLTLIELHPSASGLHGRVGSIYLLRGAREQALEHFVIAAEQSGHSNSDESLLGQAYGMCGRRAEAQRILQGLIAKSKEQYVGSLNLARIYAGLGEKDQAFKWLEKAHSERDGFLVCLRDPVWQPLRSDFRFADLLRRVGLTE